MSDRESVGARQVNENPNAQGLNHDNEPQEALLVEARGIVVYANVEAALQLGYTDPDELIGNPISHFRADFEHSSTKFFSGSSRGTLCICKNGAFSDLRERVSKFSIDGQPITIRASAVGEKNSLIGQCPKDDTSQSRNLIWVMDIEAKLLMVNQNWLTFTGHDIRHALRGGWQAVVKKTDAQAFQRTLKFALQNGKSFRMQFRLLGRDGRYQRFLCTAEPYFRVAGVFAGFIGTCSRTCDERGALHSPSAIEAQLNAILENSPDIIFIQDLQGQYVRVNRKFEEVFHSSNRGTFSQPNDEIFHCDPVVPVATNLHTIGRSPSTQKLERLDEVSGDRRTFTAKKFALTDAQGFICGQGTILTEITRLQNLEQQLVLAQKMESVGRITSGVAHDFNNLLTGVMIYCGLLLTGLPESSRLRRHVLEISHASERGAALISQLLILSVHKPQAPGIVNLNSVLVDMQDLLQKVSGESIQLFTSYAPDLRPSRLDSAQVHQIVLNLALNARDAMTAGGRMSLATQNINVGGRPEEGSPHIPPGQYVSLRVSDSGEGMDERTLKSIFNPFYSTKALGKGTGWGLATVVRLVRESGGFVRVKSKVGEGSEFTLLFPVAEGICEPEVPEPPPLPPVRTLQPETLLLVEDDDLVRQSIAESLRMTGYEVLVAVSGDAALEILANYPNRISLMISDFILPGMNGKDLARSISATHPETKILLISGYAQGNINDQEDSQPLDKSISFLRKPFSPTSLVKAVSETLKGANDLELANSAK